MALGPAIFLVSAISAPSFPTDAIRRLQRDYPIWAVQEAKSAAAVLELIVEPDGEVRSCRVVSFLGDARLARDRCAAHRRIRMTPAVGPDGEPILARYRTFISLWVEGSSERQVQRAKQAPDMVFEVSDMPQDSGGTVDIDLAVLVDAAGATIDCEAASGSANAAPPSYVEAACREVAKITAPPIPGKDGVAAAYVANFKVRFQMKA